MKEDYFTAKNIHEKATEIENACGIYAKEKSFDFDKNNTALLVLDMQKVFLSEGSNAFIPSSPAIIPIIENLINTCQKLKIPVIYTRHLNNEENAGMMNTWWRKLITERNSSSDLIFDVPESQIIRKTQYDAFYQTDLMAWLELQNRNQLIICGVMTNLCCETTLRSAFVKGYQALMPVDATAAYNLELHMSSCRNLAMGFSPPVISSELIKNLES